MAISNTLVKAQGQKNDLVEYQAGGEKIQLSPEIIRNYLAGNSAVTDQEVYMFLKLCQYQKLNPFLREAYLIKYGTSPAQMVVGKDTFIKRARHSADYLGHEAGIIVRNVDTGEVLELPGSCYTKGFQLCGGWAKVHLKGMCVPIYASVDFDEYVGKTKDGKKTSMWANKPATMIRKVALSQALREAFPDETAGMYEPEEINTVDMDDLPENPIEPPKGAVKPVEHVEAEVVDVPEDDVERELFG